MDELNNIIARDKLYTVMEFFYSVDRDIIENFHLHNAQVNKTINSKTYIFTLQTLYTIYEGFGAELDKGIPKDYMKLFSIEASMILAYEQENRGVLEELYNLSCNIVKGNYTFMKLVEDKENYNKYKTICYPCMQMINESRK